MIVEEAALDKDEVPFLNQDCNDEENHFLELFSSSWLQRPNACLGECSNTNQYTSPNTVNNRKRGRPKKIAVKDKGEQIVDEAKGDMEYW